MSKKRPLRQKRAKATAAKSGPVSPELPKELFERPPEDTRVPVMEAAAFTGRLPPPSMYGQYEHA